jgi:hypothetical protein
MREAFVAVWDGLKWCPQTNDPENQAFDFVDAPWPINPKNKLPTPRFCAGARIKFKWGEGYLRGTIKEVRAYFDTLEGTVVYDVKEIGHLRTVFDAGKADIEPCQS